MREIKFRVWDNSRKKFAKQITTFKFDRCGNINLVVYLDKANKTKEITEQEKIYTNDFEIMQYTGLKDKNGKEIYEGDVLALKTHYNDVVFGFVVFNYGAFCLSSRETYYDDELISNLGVEFETIGNIYENPELLEENND